MSKHHTHDTHATPAVARGVKTREATGRPPVSAHKGAQPETFTPAQVTAQAPDVRPTPRGTRYRSVQVVYALRIAGVRDGKLSFWPLDGEPVPPVYIPSEWDAETRSALTITPRGEGVVDEPTTGDVGGYYVVDAFTRTACFVSTADFERDYVRADGPA